MKRQAASARRCRRVAEYLAKRMEISDFVIAKSCNHHRVAILYAARKKPEKIECRFVCPVNVLEREDCRFLRGRNRGEKIAEDLVFAP